MTNHLELLRLAANAILAHRLRSALTMVGILIGIASVILLTSIGEGTRRSILAEFAQFGTRILGVHPGKTTATALGPLRTTIRKLTLDDARALEHLVGVEKVAPVAAGVARVEAGNRGRNVFVVGVTPSTLDVFKLEVRQGRFVPEGDPRRGAALAVLAPTLKRELFGEANCLGERVRIGGQRFLVIGVMGPKGNVLGLDLDDRVYVPIASAQRLFNKDDLAEIDLVSSEHASADTVRAAVVKAMRERHDGDEDFTVISQKEMLGVLERILVIVSAAVGAIGGISLVVGAVGVLTIMWIAVNERTAEIGLAKAIGASPRQILVLFLFEAGLLSLAGGALGVATGMGIAWLLPVAFPGLSIQTRPGFVVAALVASLAVGLASGVLPARRAAALDPVEALRVE
jgi:putative ABC transport system permease protein